jgi:hypothetical protein
MPVASRRDAQCARGGSEGEGHRQIAQRHRQACAQTEKDVGRGRRVQGGTICGHADPKRSSRPERVPGLAADTKAGLQMPAARPARCEAESYALPDSLHILETIEEVEEVATE